MKNLEELIPNFIKGDEDYKTAIHRKYNDFIKLSELPIKYQDHNVDNTKLPKRMNILHKNIYDIIEYNCSYMFDFNDYRHTGYLVSSLLDEYFKQSVEHDTRLKQVLYIDTNLLLDDFKKIIDRNENGDNPSLAHSIETIYNYIETADFVFWDKFTMVASAYDKQKLYNILLNRHRRSLGNIFFIKGGKRAVSEIYDIETCFAMGEFQLVDCKFEQLPFKDKDKELDIVW